MYRKLTLTACGPASNQHINQSLAMLHVTQPHAVCRWDTAADWHLATTSSTNSSNKLGLQSCLSTHYTTSCNTATRSQKQCIHRGTAIPAGPVTHCPLPFPTYTWRSENHNNTGPENRKICGLKYDTIQWRHLVAKRRNLNMGAQLQIFPYKKPQNILKMHSLIAFRWAQMVALYSVFGTTATNLTFGVIENLAENAPTELIFIVLSFIEIKQPKLAELCTPMALLNAINFVRIVQGTRPLWAIILVKIFIYNLYVLELLDNVFNFAVCIVVYGTTEPR